MPSPINATFRQAQELAARIDQLASRIEPDDAEPELIEPGPIIPSDVIEAACASAGLAMPAALREALIALPTSVEWSYDLGNYGVVDPEQHPDGLCGGFDWFNDVAKGDDLGKSIDLANRYLRPEPDILVIPFIDIGCGDVIALLPATGEVWYLDHEDPRGSSSCLCSNLDTFLTSIAAWHFPSPYTLLPRLFAEQIRGDSYRDAVEEALATESPLTKPSEKPRGLGTFDPGFPDEVARRLGADHPLARAARQAQENMERVAPGFIERQGQRKARQQQTQEKTKKSGRRWWPFGGW